MLFEGIRIIQDNKKKILITGATGFIGRYLVKNLLLKKKNLIIIGRRNYIDLPEEMKGTDLIEYIQHDLLYPAENRINLKCEIDSVVNLATVMPDKIIPHDDFPIIARNIMQTIHLIELLKCYPPPRIFIQGSTIDVYPFLSSPLDESVPPEPESNYAASKLSCELICKTEIKKWIKTGLTILRFSQIYGAGDTHSKVIPQFIHNALTGEKIEIHGEGREFRTFIYIEDAIRAIELSMEKCPAGIFNIAGDSYHTIKEVADLIKELSPIPVSITYKPAKKLSSSSIISIKKARDVLGFYPEYSLEKGIRETIKKESAGNAP